MKANSDNIFTNAFQDVLEILKNESEEVIVYEPTLNVGEFFKCRF